MQILALAKHVTIATTIAFVKLPGDISYLLFKSYSLADSHFYFAVALGSILRLIGFAALWVRGKIICAGKWLLDYVKTKLEEASL